MKKILLIISLFLGFFARSSFASEMNIIEVPMDGIPVGSTFPVVFEVIEAEPDTSYNFKFYGGPENDNNSIQTYSLEHNKFLSVSDDWIDMPSFNTDSSGGAIVDGIAKVAEGKSYCSDIYNPCYAFFVRIADSVNQIGFSGYQQDIKIFPPLPTPTPKLITPTIALIPTIVPSLLTPTKKPTSSNHNPIPTLTPIPTINMTIFGTKISSTLPPSKPLVSDLDLLLESSSSAFIETGSNPSEPTPSSIPKPKKNNYFPLFFIGLSALFLFTPLIFTQIKIKPKCLKK